MSDVIEIVAREVRTVLHNKLFAMNGYTKLPGALDKTDEIVDLVVSTTIQTLADNVTDEMVEAFKNKLEPYTDASGFNYHAALAAALRAVNVQQRR